MYRFLALLVFSILFFGSTYAQITGTLSAVLTKTVGLDPAICATQSSIQVPPGSEVYYCYEVQNTTQDFVYDTHHLVDDQLGWLLDNFPFSLGPGQTVFITSPATIVTTTTNLATWTMSGVDLPSVVITDTATVNVSGDLGAFKKTVGVDPNVCALTAAITVSPATEVFYCYEIENTSGGTYERHDVVDDQLGNVLSDFAFALSPGGSAWFTVSSLINATTTNVATWTMSSGPVTATLPVAVAQDLPPFTGTDTATVTVEGDPAVLNKTVGLDPSICAVTKEISVPAGTEVHYCYEVENTSGSSYETHTLVDDQLGTILSDFAFGLAPGASVWITETTVILTDTTNVATWTLSAPGLPPVSVNDSAVVTVQLAPPPRLDGILTKTVGTDPSVCSTETSVEVLDGTVVAYCYTFQNKSTIPLNYHTLADDQLGTLLADQNTPVPPEGILQEIFTATMNADTVNNAVWTASEGPAAEPGPTVAPTASASVTVTTPPVVNAPIPTLSEWGIVLLALLLLGAGVVVLRRTDSESA